LVVCGVLLGGLATASRATPVPDDINFSRLIGRRPVPGRFFVGLAVVNRTGLYGNPERFLFVHCDAAVGGRRLRARVLVYGKPRSGDVQVYACGWLIPADAAGKTLRFWENSGLGYPGPFAVVGVRGGRARSDPYTWRVASP
jgi:hypothetical protein